MVIVQKPLLREWLWVTEEEIHRARQTLRIANDVAEHQNLPRPPPQTSLGSEGSAHREESAESRILPAIRFTAPPLWVAPPMAAPRPTTTACFAPSESPLRLRDPSSTGDQWLSRSPASASDGRIGGLPVRPAGTDHADERMKFAPANRSGSSIRPVAARAFRQPGDKPARGRQ